MYVLLAADPPEVTSSQRMVHAWPGGRADLTCIIKAQPRAIVSILLKVDSFFVDILLSARIDFVH